MITAIRRFLPRGQTLPPDIWWRRHRGIVVLLWLHVPVVLGFGIAKGVGPVHAAVEASAIVGFAWLATVGRHHQRLSNVIAAVGLMTCSAELVHLSGGLIEMHFHYFVMVGVVTLYQDWRPFLAAIGFVLFQHGIMGAIAPESVYNHVDAQTNPWAWAAVHGSFILGMSVAGIISWRLNEALLDAVGERQHQLAEAQELAGVGSWTYRRGHGSTWSDEMYRIVGVEPGFETTGAALLPLIHPDDRDAWKADMDRCTYEGTPHSLDVRIVLPDGAIRWVHGRGEVVSWAAPGEPEIMQGTVQDVTARRRSEDALRASESELLGTLSLLNATLDATADGILVVDTNGAITSANRRFAELWQIPDDLLATRDDALLLGYVLRQLADPDGFVAKIEELYSHPEAESDDTVEFADGRIFERSSRPQRVNGEVVGRVWGFRDVTERKRLEDELAHQAFHDSLTKLANQALFRDRVGHALARGTRSGAGTLAVLFLDLDNFKTVNDSLGHPAGDQLLVHVTHRLLACLRPADTAARLGGDEFAVLLEDLPTMDAAVDTAQRILDALQAPFTIAGKEIVVGASVGVAEARSESSTDQLLRNADLAMYTAKNRGKGRAELFAPEMHRAAMDRLDLEADLRQAIQRQEFVVRYQPIVDVIDGHIRGVEALVRWQHPRRGLVGPDDFIELAEECGLICDIGRWVLEEACAQAARWRRELPDTPLSVSVNLSPRQLHDASIVTEVEAALARTGLPPSALTLEITEGAMMHDTEVALERLHALKAVGVRLAVDDFGTGYSSLSYLQRFPIDVLKIDKSFVQRLDHGPEDSSLARAIIRLAQTLQLSAVGEGVETDAQLDMLMQLGCPLAQGFLLARPVDADGLTELLAADQPVPAAG